MSFYVKNQNFRVYESSNIHNKNKQVNKRHFLSCKTYVSSETCHAHCSNLLKVIILVKKQHLETFEHRIKRKFQSKTPLSLTNKIAG